jgi:hypothetical protein
MRTIAIAILGSVFVFSCGGPTPKPTTPLPANDAGEGTTSNGGSSTTTGADAGAPSTTLMLGDGGELQGTKLQQSSTMVMQTTGSDAGASPLNKDGEVGRRPSDIQTIILTHRDDARACYDAERKKNPKIAEGNLDIGWVLDPKGNVTSAAVIDATTDVKEPAVANCIIGIIKGIKWAESQKGFETKAHYPFNFKRNVAPKK